MAVTNGKRDLEKEKYWLGIVERQRQSGKSQAQFCKDEGLNDRQFYYWNSVLAKRQKGKNRARPVNNQITMPFVSLQVPGQIDFGNRVEAAERIEISKIVVRISSSTDKSTLACILQSLEKA